MLECFECCRLETTCNHNPTEVVASLEKHHLAAFLHMEKNFQVIQRNLPPNDPFMAGAYNNMGAMLLFAKDYSLALAYFEKALNVLSKSSNNHSMLAMTYSNMVTAFAGLGDYNEAADYNRRAVTTTTSGNMGLNNVISKNYEDELD